MSKEYGAGYSIEMIGTALYFYTSGNYKLIDLNITLKRDLKNQSLFFHRYNLAKISYIPYLLSNNINTELVLERPEWEHMFSDENSR